MANPAPPPGGFQNGGWYEGRQYWNGQFGAPGVIINPNQVGAGQPVSSEVNRQSDVQQGLQVGTIDKYLQEQTQKYYAEGGGAPPTNAGQVTPDLNNFQAGMFDGGGDIATRMGEISKLVTPSTPAPTPLNRVQEFQNMRTQYGVQQLEQNLTDVNKQIADVQSLAEQRQYKAETGQVALGVIGGRQSEIQRQTQIQLDTLNRAKAVMVDELNMKYGIINQMINFMGLDYQDAVQAYDKAFERNMNIYQVAYKEKQDAQTVARANLQIYANAITNGNMNYNQLSADQRLMLNKLEIQSGLPVGFTASLRMSPKDSLLLVSEDKTQAVVLDANGNPRTISTGITKSTSGSGGGTGQERIQAYTKEAFSEMENILSKLGGSDGIVSGAEWDNALSSWLRTVPGATQEQFVNAFQKHTNPDWGSYSGINK